MPKYEYRGIVARPGTFRRKDGSQVKKTWEELKKSFTLTPEIMLTLGHPLTPDRRPRPADVRDYLGRVVPVINEDKQVIEGQFKFYDEPWERIPEHIRERIVNDLPVEISAGYTAKTEGEVQTGMLHHHIALLADNESPICPLGECGINVRLESDQGEYDIMQYEQATSTKDEQDTEPEQAAEEQASEAQGPQSVTFTKDQFDQLLQALRPQNTHETPEPEVGASQDTEPSESAQDTKETEEQAEAPEEEPAQEEPEPEPDLEPKRAFPAGRPGKRKNPALQEDGSVKIPMDIYLGGTDKTKKKE